eukprot:UN03079
MSSTKSLIRPQSIEKSFFDTKYIVICNKNSSSHTQKKVPSPIFERFGRLRTSYSIQIFLCRSSDVHDKHPGKDLVRAFADPFKNTKIIIWVKSAK